jgi:hypothetical protein
MAVNINYLSLIHVYIYERSLHDIFLHIILFFAFGEKVN